MSCEGVVTVVGMECREGVGSAFLMADWGRGRSDQSWPRGAMSSRWPSQETKDEAKTSKDTQKLQRHKGGC
jgi:hypothetical protein